MNPIKPTVKHYKFKYITIIDLSYLHYIVSVQLYLTHCLHQLPNLSFYLRINGAPDVALCVDNAPSVVQHASFNGKKAIVSFVCNMKTNFVQIHGYTTHNYQFEHFFTVFF